jgi:hypothetical protein
MAGLWMLTLAAGQAPAPPERAADFLASLGVNTHLSYSDSDYARSGAVLADLAYLGVDRVRDAAPSPIKPGQNSYHRLAEAGVRFDFVIGGGKPIADTLAGLDEFAKAHPDAIESIEGPNEVNNWPVKFDGKTGASGAIAFQAAFRAAQQQDALLRGVPLYNLTSWPDLPAPADFGNYHSYPRHGDQPFGQLSRDMAEQKVVMPLTPMVLTETGYYTLPSDPKGWGGVDEETQAKLLLNVLLDAYALGARRTFAYQLLDAYADASASDPEKHFGLFDHSNRPKAAANAIHNLTRLLSGGPAGDASFAPRPLTYAINGSAAERSVLLAKSSGDYALVIWNEAPAWDFARKARTAAPSQPAVIHFDREIKVASVYDPLVGASPLSVSHKLSQLSVGVSDHPIVIDLID